MAAIGNKKGEPPYTRGLFDTEAKEFDCKPYRISRSDRFLHQPGEDSRWRCCLLGQFPHILDALGHEDRAQLVAKGNPALPPHLLPGVVSVRHQVDAGETAQCPDVLLLESAPQRSHCRVSPLPQERASGDAGRGTGLTQPAQSNRGPIFRAESLLRRLLLGPVSSWAIFPHPCLMPVEIGHPSVHPPSLAFFNHSAAGRAERHLRRGWPSRHQPFACHRLSHRPDTCAQCAPRYTLHRPDLEDRRSLIAVLFSSEDNDALSARLSARAPPGAGLRRPGPVPVTRPRRVE